LPGGLGRVALVLWAGCCAIATMAINTNKTPNLLTVFRLHLLVSFHFKASYDRPGQAGMRSTQ